MEILLSFHEKPRNASKEEAIRIAAKCGARIENGRVIVPFREFTPEAKELLSRCRRWKGFTVTINGSEYNLDAVIDVVTCSSKQKCDGICHLYVACSQQLYGLIVSEFEHRSKYASFYSLKSALTSPYLMEWIDITDDDSLVLRKKQLREAILRDSTVPLLLCEKCSPEQIARKIHSLPDRITFTKKTPQNSTNNQRRSPAERKAEQWYNIGCLRDQHNDYLLAIEAYDKSLALDSEWIPAIFNRGFDLLLLKRYREAEVAFARTSELYPNDAYTFKYWSMALQGLGDKQRAAELMARAEQLQPGIRDEPFP